MKFWWKRSLALSLGLVAGGLRAGEPVDPPARPVIASTGPRAAAVTLDRPVPITGLRPSAAVIDPALRPTSYSNPTGDAYPVIRAQAPDPVSPKPLPAGPSSADGDPNGSPRTPPALWHRHPETPAPPGGPPEPAPLASGSPVVASAGPAFASAPVPGTPVPQSTVPAPAIAGPVWSMLHGSFGSDPCNPCPADCCAAGGACCDGCGCGGCTFDNRYYISADFLLWWIKGSNTPPLVTRGSTSDAVPGALGLPGTSVLFGGHGVEDNPFPGGRLDLGYWFGDQHLLGVDVGGFFLGQQGRNFSATSFGNPVLARPIIDALTGTETTELVAGPGVLAGTINVRTESQLWGYEANLRSNLFCGKVCGADYYVDGILGFRGLGLDESLTVNEALTVIGGPSAGQQFAINDRFATSNRFYGAQIGTLSEFRWGRWVLDLNGKIGFGPTEELVRISGSTAITPLGGATRTFNGGLLALPTNIGHYDRNEFTVVPEFGLNIGYQWTDHTRFYIGYDFLYWSSVVRPGNQIDRTVNPNLLPPAVGGGPARPAFTYNASDFWAQGLTFGVEFRY